MAVQGRIAISHWSHSISRKINYPVSTAATKSQLAIDLHIHFLQFVNYIFCSLVVKKFVSKSKMA